MITSLSYLEILKKLKIKELRDFQREAIEKGLLNGRSFLISAPSGSGKTLVAELAMIWQINNGKKVIYTAPYRALCNEKYERFQKLGSLFEFKVIISTGDVDIINEDVFEKADVIVCTYEKFDSFLRQKVRWLEKVGLVVIDEIHEIDSEGRGARLEGAIARLKRDYHGIQIIALSATIANAEEPARWLEIDLIESNYRPVPLKHEIIISPDKNKKVLELVEYFLNKDKSIIVFTSRRRDAESLALKISRITSVKLSDDEKRKIRHYIESIENEDLQTFLGRKVVATILRGTGFHHAGLSYYLRKMIEDMFNKKMIKVLVGTTTLGAGINTPASVVIIRDLSIPSIYSQMIGFEVKTGVIAKLLDSNRVHQMLGRAGRPGFDDEGTGILLVSSNDEKNLLKKKYFDENMNPKYEKIESKITFMDLMEQILIFITTNPGCTKEDLANFLSSLYKYRNADIEDINSILEYASASDIENIVRAITDMNEYKKAKAIPDSAVVIFNIRGTRVDGEVEGIYCGFNNGPFCYCKNFQICDQNKKLCRHTAKLLMSIANKNAELASSILGYTSNDVFPIESLVKHKFIEIRESAFYPTELGMLTTRLYIRPTTSFLIKKFLSEVETLMDFLILIDKIATLELNLIERKSMAMAILSLLKGLRMPEVCDKFNIAMGDFEIYIDFAKWLARVFTIMAQWLGLDDVYSIGRQVLAGLNSLQD